MDVGNSIRSARGTGGNAPRKATTAHRLRRWRIDQPGWRLAAIALAAALLGAGCATDSAEPIDPSQPGDPGVSASPSAEPGTPPPPATGGDDDSGGAPGTTDDAQAGLSGEPIEFFFQAGDTLAVVGVDRDDVLNVRAGPGIDQQVVGRLSPLADDVTASGATRQLSRSIWSEVDTGDVSGWASARYLGYLGSTADVTSEVVAELGDARVAETMLDLGRSVARTRASVDPQSDIVVVAGPTVGDLGEVTIDIIGLGDDSILGLRLHVFGQPAEAADSGFDLKSVEETIICGRGVTDNGLCV